MFSVKRKEASLQGNRISFLELLYKLHHNKQAFKALLCWLLPHSSISVIAQIWLIFTRYAFQRNGNGFLDLSTCIRVLLHRRRRSVVDALGPALLHRRDEVQKEVGHVLSCCDPGG